MSQRNDAAVQPGPIRLSRVFPASRDAVFKAWMSADHVKRWFSPETYTVPDATVEPWVGGRFDVCMRSSSGEEHWMRGTFVDIVPNTKLVIDTRVADSLGRELFLAHTEVTFSDAAGGTRLDVVQTYTLLDPSAAGMLSGAPEGWRTTLDKLERVATRPAGP